MATIHDVAHEAGVSIATVSRVLNKKGRYSKEIEHRVLAAVKKVGYHTNFTAWQLKTGRKGVLGIVSKEYYLLNNPSLLQSIITTAISMGFSTELMLNASLNDCIDFVLGHRYDGVLIIDPENDEKSLHTIVQGGFTGVFLGGDISREDVNLVEIDFFQSGYIATKHLLHHGHTDIAFIEDTPELYFTQEIKRGYLFALDEYGIQYREELLISPHGFSFRSREELGYRAFRKLTGIKCTAVFTTDYSIARGVLRAASESEKTFPDNLSLISCCDQNQAGYLFPPLTTIPLPYRQLGALSTEILTNAIKKNDRVVKRIKLKVQLSENRSVIKYSKKLTKE